MHPDDVWRVIDAQRLSVADLLEQLTEEQWRQPSLCEGWTVRAVAAHLTMQQTGFIGGVRELVRYPAGMKRMIHDSACRRAAMPTERMVAEIRGMVGSRKHNFGVTYRETLIDILVHGQDIAVPLGRRHAMPPGAAAFAASRVWARGYPFYPRKRLNGFRLSASDADWSVGDGADVHGPIDAILLLLTGRLAGVPQLSGDGAPTLLARVAHTRT